MCPKPPDRVEGLHETCQAWFPSSGRLWGRDSPTWCQGTDIWKCSHKLDLVGPLRYRVEKAPLEAHQLQCLKPYLIQWADAATHHADVSGTKKQPKEKVFRLDIPRTSWGRLRGRPGSKPSGRASKSWKTSIPNSRQIPPRIFASQSSLRLKRSWVHPWMPLHNLTPSVLVFLAQRLMQVQQIGVEDLWAEKESALKSWGMGSTTRLASHNRYTSTPLWGKVSLMVGLL